MQLIFYIASLAGMACGDNPSSELSRTVLPDNDIVMKAIVDELDRSMEHLALEDLPQPYFIQYNAEDRITFRMSASYGALVSDGWDRKRSIRSRVRVGSHSLDNTNIGYPAGGRASLPIDDDYMALRQAIWYMTDRDYKRAVEGLTRKKAFLKEKNVVDRPDDFSPANCVTHIDPSPEIVFVTDTWRQRLRRLSQRFAMHPKIQSSHVSLFAGAINEWVVNSDGAQLRMGDTGAFLEIRAELQAEEGMRLSDHRLYLAQQPEDLPPVEKIEHDIDAMCADLVALHTAPLLEEYTGPVLFAAPAAGKALHALLASGLCARPVPLGRGGRGDDSLEKKIGRRILPRSFSIVDDPKPTEFEGMLLAGAYEYDDEAVAAEAVTLVDKGILKNMLASRAPTRKIKDSNGHGRSGGFGDAQAHAGCLYVKDDAGKSADELTQLLIDAARDEGLEFGLRITALGDGGTAALGDPVYAYKVYVEDGREELVRGLEFRDVQRASLKRVLAGGTDREVYNSASGVPISIITPALLFDELELAKTDKEFDRLPFLPPPWHREGS